MDQDLINIITGGMGYRRTGDTRYNRPVFFCMNGLLENQSIWVLEVSQY